MMMMMMIVMVIKMIHYYTRTKMKAQLGLNKRKMFCLNRCPMKNREGRREWGSDGGDHSRWRKATFMKLLRRCYDLPQEVSSTLIGS